MESITSAILCLAMMQAANIALREKATSGGIVFLFAAMGFMVAAVTQS